MANPVTQFQILSRNPDKTAEFYTNLFGWVVIADNPLGCRQIRTGSVEGIQGAIWPAPLEASNFVQLFMTVADVSSATRKAEELGGKVIVPPTMLPEGDEMAILLDPEGMSFAVWKSGTAPNNH
jgi:uncharacterized protein